MAPMRPSSKSTSHPTLQQEQHDEGSGLARGRMQDLVPTKLVVDSVRMCGWMVSTSAGSIHRCVRAATAKSLILLRVETLVLRNTHVQTQAEHLSANT